MTPFSLILDLHVGPSTLDSLRVSLVFGQLIVASLAELLIGDGRTSLHQAADEAPEDESSVARMSAIKAKDELVQIGVQVLVFHRPLMGAEQPAL